MITMVRMAAVARASGVAPWSRGEPPPLPSCGVVAGIFDLDGTLVASEYLNPLAWDKVLRDIGAIGAEDSVQRITRTPEFIGASAPAIAQRVIEIFDITSYTAAELVMKKRAESIALAQLPVSQGGPDLASLWYAGVQQQLCRLHDAGVTLALCTSNLRPITTAILAAGLVDDVLSKRIVQEDIGNDRMKPDPTPYRRALALVGDDAGRTVAFEDSVSGVRSAVGAGIAYVLGVCNSSESDEEAVATAHGLLAAGAVATFRTTVDAIDWVLEEMQRLTDGRPKL